MPNHFRDIHLFHQKFGLLPVAAQPTALSAELSDFRVKFMQEELDEYRRAVASGDLEAQHDALIDLVYVAMGTAYLQRLPFNTGWDNVQLANMKKVRALRAGDSERGSTFDVVKPPGWQPPNHAYLHDALISAPWFDLDIAEADDAP